MSIDTALEVGFIVSCALLIIANVRDIRRTNRARKELDRLATLHRQDREALRIRKADAAEDAHVQAALARRGRGA